ncbi:MAG TPA: DinB family protein [Anaerolineales bacterium]|nr:DinB family protein [Anaerolineales bacterium]
MMTKRQNPNAVANRQQILSELQMARATFHRLLDSLSNEDFYKPSLNPGWTNGEILVHMTFGFIIVNVLLPMARLWGWLPKGSSKWFAWLLNAVTGPFNWINELGARGQGKIFTRTRIGTVYDRAYFSLLRKINSIKDEEWQRGMYYPTKWDPNFSEFMTLEKLFHYPVNHFNFHLTQISHGRERM